MNAMKSFQSTFIRLFFKLVCCNWEQEKKNYYFHLCLEANNPIDIPFEWKWIDSHCWPHHKSNENTVLCIVTLRKGYKLPTIGKSKSICANIISFSAAIISSTWRCMKCNIFYSYFERYNTYNVCTTGCE